MEVAPIWYGADSEGAYGGAVQRISSPASLLVALITIVILAVMAGLAHHVGRAR